MVKLSKQIYMPVLTHISFTDNHHRKIKRVVAQCGNCGNTLDRWGDRNYCQFCRTRVDWSECGKATEIREELTKRVVKL